MIDTEMIRNVFREYFNKMIAAVPALITPLLILLAGWLVARLVASIARRLAARLGLDALVQQSGLGGALSQARIKRLPSELSGVLIFWLIFASFLLVALENLGLTLAIVPLQALIGYFPKILAAIFVLIVGALLAQLIGRAVHLATLSMGVEFHETLGRAARGFLLVVTILLAVGQLGLDISFLTDSLTNLLMIAAAGFAIAFGLGGRDVARNVLAGYYARETFPMGSKIEIDGYEGILDAIGTMNSEIRVREDRLIIPNTRLTESTVRIRESQKPNRQSI